MLGHSTLQMTLHYLRNVISKEESAALIDNALSTSGKESSNDKAKELVDTNTRTSEENTILYLKKYKELLDSGIITQKEFDIKKAQLLG